LRCLLVCQGKQAATGIFVSSAGKKPKSTAQGAGQLVIDATLGVVDLVEALHTRIERLPGIATPKNERSGGLTGFIYHSIRGITKAVGFALDKALAQLGTNDESHNATSLARQASIAALNGVVGDHLASSNNPLAIDMHLLYFTTPARCASLKFSVRSKEQLRTFLDSTSPENNGYLIMLHGLCMNPWQWQRAGHDHGVRLAQERALTPLYLYYNTGLSVAENGRLLSELLQVLVSGGARRMVLLAHSMGGLVARSALHHGAASSWPHSVTEFITLGTPHGGAKLERIGVGVDNLLSALPYAAPFARLGKLRSHGINDLRLGLPATMALPEQIRCIAIAGGLGPVNSLSSRLLGDGLVSVNSAFGRHRNAAKSLKLAAEQCILVPGVGHLDLLSSQAVYQHLLAAIGNTKE
jgi:pimeloyl-ACP methyl ester carboxylesterase